MADSNPRRKPRVNITPDPELWGWLASQCGPGRRFSTLTHAVEVCIRAQMQVDEENERIAAEYAAERQQIIKEHGSIDAWLAKQQQRRA